MGVDQGSIDELLDKCEMGGFPQFPAALGSGLPWARARGGPLGQPFTTFTCTPGDAGITMQAQMQMAAQRRQQQGLEAALRGSIGLGYPFGSVPGAKRPQFSVYGHHCATGRWIDPYTGEDLGGAKRTSPSLAEKKRYVAARMPEFKRSMRILFDELLIPCAILLAARLVFAF